MPLPSLLFALAVSQYSCVPTLASAGIVVDAERVWIRGADLDQTVTVFDRRRREWRVERSFPDSAHASTGVVAPGQCVSGGDSLVIAPDLQLVARDSAVNGARWELRHGARAVPVKIADRLRPRPRPRDPNEDERERETEATEFSPHLSAVLRDGDLVWLGLFGGYAGEGGWTLGGLLRYSMRTRALASFAPERLRDVAISAMAVAGGTLWLGTQGNDDRDYGDGLYGAGLVRLGRDGAFTAFTADSTPLPGDLIAGLASVGDTLWIATERGVAMLDTRAMRWDRRFYRTMYTMDSVYMTLSAEDPELVETVADRASEMIIRLADELRVPDRRGFISTALALPPEPFSELLADYASGAEGPRSTTPLHNTEEAAASVLTHPRLLPFIRQTLRGGGRVYLASMVFRELGDSTWIAEMRAAMRVAPRYGAAQIAELLADDSDSTALVWVAAQLRDRAARTDSVRPYEDATSARDQLAGIAMRHPTPEMLPGLEALWLETGHPLALIAIWQQKNVRARIAAARVLERHPLQASNWIGLALRGDSLTRADAAGAAELRRVLLATLTAFAAMPDSAWTSRYSLAEQVARDAAAIRDPAAIPLLIEWLPRAYELSRNANEALIVLTGAQPLPTVDWNLREQQARFWRDWWRVNARGFAPATRQAGEEALARWQRRLSG